MQKIFLKWKEILNVIPDLTFFKFKDEFNKWNWIVAPDSPIYHIEVDWLWVWLHQDWDNAIYMRYKDETNQKEYVLYSEEYSDKNDEMLFKQFIDQLDDMFTKQDDSECSTYDILSWL